MKTLTIRQFPPLGYACNEAINTLCTNLSFAGAGVKKIMVTSCHAAEGKTFLTMNVMRMLAKFGRTVALVDADLRRSMISAKYTLQFEESEERQGLSHMLAGMAEEEQVVYRTRYRCSTRRGSDGCWTTCRGSWTTCWWTRRRWGR